MGHVPLGKWGPALAFACVLAAGVVGVPAEATVLYQYRSFCELDCGNIGLAAGDAVGGYIGISDSAAALGVVLSPADIDLFDVHFGVFAFLLPSLGSAFAVFTGPAQESFSFQFVTNALVTDPGYAFVPTNWIAGASVYEAATGGAGTLRRVLLVPEPPPLALIGTALVALWLRARAARTTTTTRA